jgi:Rha family phage regulatory protein
MDIHHELISANLRTTSRLVADKFGKRHDNVLRDIEKLTDEVPDGFAALNFEASTYLDSTGRTLPMVELTRDGFTLLAMGFTGKPAMEWKVRFIEAFNLMEAELSAKAAPVADANLPARFGTDLTTREKVSMIRETRLAHGIHAARRMWTILDLPNVTGTQAGQSLLADPAEGRACLTYLLGLDVGGRQVGSWLSDGQDHLVLNRVGLRVREDGLFVSHATAAFQASRWSGARHRVALATLDGVHPYHTSLSLAGTQQRGLLVPLSVAAGVHHA